MSDYEFFLLRVLVFQNQAMWENLCPSAAYQAYEFLSRSGYVDPQEGEVTLKGRLAVVIREAA